MGERFFRQVESGPDHDRALYPEEIRAVTSGLLEACRQHELLRELNAGTLILSSQEYDYNAQLVGKFHLNHRPFDESLAAESVEQMLTWPSRNSRFKALKIERATIAGEQKYPSNGIYHSQECEALVLNGAEQRFVAAFRGAVRDNEYQNFASDLLLVALARALSCVLPDDDTLETSATEVVMKLAQIGHLMYAGSSRPGEQIHAAADLVVQAFQQHTTTDIKDWVLWRAHEIIDREG